jgi:hypothetical protein
MRRRSASALCQVGRIARRDCATVREMQLRRRRAHPDEEDLHEAGARRRGGRRNGQNVSFCRAKARSNAARNAREGVGGDRGDRLHVSERPCTSKVPAAAKKRITHRASSVASATRRLLRDDALDLPHVEAAADAAAAASGRAAPAQQRPFCWRGAAFCAVARCPRFQRVAVKPSNATRVRLEQRTKAKARGRHGCRRVNDTTQARLAPFCVGSCLSTTTSCCVRRAPPAGFVCACLRACLRPRRAACLLRLCVHAAPATRVPCPAAMHACARGQAENIPA